MILYHLGIGKRYAQSKQLRDRFAGVGDRTRRIAKQSMHAAARHDDGIRLNRHVFAGIGIAHHAAAADVSIQQQGFKDMVIQPRNAFFDFPAAHRVNHRGNQLFAGIALCKCRALVFLSAKRAHIYVILFCAVKLHAERIQLPDELRRRLRQSVHRLRICQPARSAQGIRLMLLRRVAFSLGVQRRIDAALRHDRLRPFRRLCGHQNCLLSLLRRRPSRRQSGKPCANNQQCLFHTCHLI